MIRPHLAAWLMEAARRALPAGEWPPVEVFLARDPRFGDYTSRWPLRLAGVLKRPPAPVAEAIAAAAPPDPAVAAVEAAAGHLNLRLGDAWLADQLMVMLTQGRFISDGFKLGASITDTDLGVLDDAGRESLDDPAYMVRYTGARLHSLIRLAEQEGIRPGTDGFAAELQDEVTRALVLQALAWPDEADGSAGPDRLVRYLVDLSRSFHRFYGRHRLFGQPPAIAGARLLIMQGTLLALEAVMVDRLGRSAPVQL